MIKFKFKANLTLLLRGGHFYDEKTFEDYDLTPYYSITAENISKSRKSNSTKNPTYENFGHLNQSQLHVFHT